MCVCIPEFLSLYETERLVQELTKMDIDVHNIVVNQLLRPEKSPSGTCDCTRLYKILNNYSLQVTEIVSLQVIFYVRCVRLDIVYNQSI